MAAEVGCWFVASAAGKKEVVGCCFEGFDGGFDVRWSVWGVPGVVPNVKFRIIAFVVFSSHAVSDSKVSPETVKVDRIFGLASQGQAVAKAKAKSFE
jgi:hypothetical protein